VARGQVLIKDAGADGDVRLGSETLVVATGRDEVVQQVVVLIGVFCLFTQ